MGIINQGILGGFSGKVGPIVGFHWKSKYYIRARAAKVSNPRTPKQQEQRGKFATAFSFLKAIKPFIRINYIFCIIQFFTVTHCDLEHKICINCK